MDEQNESMLQALMARLDAVEQKLYLQKQVMNVAEVADYLGVSKQAVYMMTSQKLIPHYKPLKQIFFKKQDVLDFAFSHKVEVVMKKSRAKRGRQGG